MISEVTLTLTFLANDKESQSPLTFLANDKERSVSPHCLLLLFAETLQARRRRRRHRPLDQQDRRGQGPSSLARAFARGQGLGSPPLELPAERPGLRASGPLGRSGGPGRGGPDGLSKHHRAWAEGPFPGSMIGLGGGFGADPQNQGGPMPSCPCG